MRTPIACLTVAATTLLCACGAATTPSGQTQTPTQTQNLPGLHVRGNTLVDGDRPLRLLGVNRSGAEYSCVQGHGIFDGPVDAGSIAAIASWHADVVRVPLNEDCWLGINGVPANFSGNSYRGAIQAYVARLHQAGFAVILDLHWTAPGSVLATQQLPMPDQDHAPAFWRSVATTFSSDHELVFDLFNEPFPSTANTASADPWTCWRDGCTMQPGQGVSNSWPAAGMQQLVDAVRSTGATQPLMAGGIQWSDDLSGWLAHRPADPLGQLAASFHLYSFNACATSQCWTSTVQPVASQVPVVTGELGENDCAGGFIDGYMPWADRNGISYLGWTWDTWDCRSGPALITDYSGTPTAFGAALRAHLQSVPAR